MPVSVTPPSCGPDMSGPYIVPPPGVGPGGRTRLHRPVVDLDLSYTPATELARLIRAGELSAVEAVRNSLERIEQVNPTLNCFCFVYPDEALERAGEADRAAAAGGELGPAARRSDRDQGPDADGGQDDDDGLVRLRALRSRPKRAHRRQAARCRRDHGRQDDHAGVRLLELHGEPAVGDHAEPVESRAGRRAAPPAAPARRWRPAACRSPREATWADRYASRRRGRARSG